MQALIFKSRKFYPLSRFLLFLIALVVAIGLRLIGVKDETRIFWDEGRPCIERVIEDPINTYAEMLCSSWGRPGLVTMKLMGLGVEKKVFGSWSPAQGFSEIPILFQISLDVFSMFMMFILVVMIASLRESPDLRERIDRGLIATFCWALSSTLIRYSHRMLAPVYVLPFLLISLVAMVVVMRRVISSYVAWLCVGFLFGLTFSVYPGAYHVLLFSPLVLLLAKDISLRQFIITCGVMFLGAAACLVGWQLLTLGALRLTDSQGLSYANQVMALSGSINQGDVAEVPVYLFRFLIAQTDSVMAVSLFFAVVGGRHLFWPGQKTKGVFAVWLVLVYFLWFINGPLLNREVLYGRVVVLVFPVIILAGTLSIPSVWFKRSFNWIWCAMFILGLFSTHNVLKQRPHRVTNQQLIDIASQITGIPSSEVVLIRGSNDYGRMHSTKALRELQYTSIENAIDPAMFIAFNQRAISHPATPFTRYLTPPLFVVPSPIRHPWNRFEGHGLAERRYIESNPEHYDVKVFSVSDFVRAQFEIVNDLESTDFSSRATRPSLGASEDRL